MKSFLKNWNPTYSWRVPWFIYLHISCCCCCKHFGLFFLYFLFLIIIRTRTRRRTRITIRLCKEELWLVAALLRPSPYVSWSWGMTIHRKLLFKWQYWNAGRFFGMMEQCYQPWEQFAANLICQIIRENRYIDASDNLRLCPTEQWVVSNVQMLTFYSLCCLIISIHISIIFLQYIDLFK